VLYVVVAIVSPSGDHAGSASSAPCDSTSVVARLPFAGSVTT
jgi:hypothetical protein